MRQLAWPLVLALCPAMTLAQTRVGLLREVDGPRHGSAFGYAMALAGDIDGDGRDDLAVAAPWEFGATGGNGVVRVVSGRDGKILRTWSGPKSSFRYGYALAGGADFDRDGTPDVAVGDPFARDARNQSVGAVAIRSGKTGAVLRAWSGSSRDSLFGHAVAMLGDVDRDGAIDVLVGVRELIGAHRGQGSVRVYSGRTGTQLYRRDGREVADGFGHAVCVLGDLDRDGVDDFAVSAPFSSTAAGYVRVFSGVSGKVLRTVERGVRGDGFGFALAPTGDVDRDAVPDLIVGADQHANLGWAGVYSGRTGRLLFQWSGETFSRFGAAVAGAGDPNRDGWLDVLVGAPGTQHQTVRNCGRVVLYSGRDGSVLQDERSQRSTDWLGRSLVGGFDANGDGLADWAAGRNRAANQPGLVGSVAVWGRRPGSVTPFGSACRGTAGLPSLHRNNDPLVGAVFRVNASTLPSFQLGALMIGTSATRWRGIALPFDLSPFGLTGCRLWTGGDITVPFSSGLGSAVLGFAIPQRPTLATNRVYLQAFVRDPSANRAGIIATNGLLAVIGNGGS